MTNRQFASGFFTGIILLVCFNAIQEGIAERPLNQEKVVADLRRELRLAQTPRTIEVESLAEVLAVNDEAYKKDVATTLAAMSTNPKWKTKFEELYTQNLLQLRRQIAASLLVVASLEDWQAFFKGEAPPLIALICTQTFEAVTTVSRKNFGAEKGIEAQVLLGMTDDEVMNRKP